jgi:hypothetical protein
MKSRTWKIERTLKRPGDLELTSTGFVRVTYQEPVKPALKLVRKAA